MVTMRFLIPHMSLILGTFFSHLGGPGHNLSPMKIVMRVQGMSNRFCGIGYPISVLI